MSQKNPNPCIRCRVSSCAYHCGGDDYCSLQAIQVEPCDGCGPCEGGNRNTGRKADESMCGSYRRD